ncbi:MAG: hypothetical protein E7552_03345 [Ruminococcaceae bacterium]|nr:hypothetical protein [Oscillospiraceae bacterium]
MLTFNNTIDKELFDRYMQYWDKQYDTDARMVRVWRGANGYHSKLSECTVHAVRESLEYAYNLLRRDAHGDRARARNILYRVLPLQDIDPTRNTYGIWSYFLEEWSEEMDMPDWNWADFNAKSLLRMLLTASHALTDDLKARMKDAIWHACCAIINRNVNPHYTNISVMGAYVTCVAGEMFGWDEVLAYGKRRLQGLYEYNKQNGSFSEFNSPTYTFVVLHDLGDFIVDVQNSEYKRMAEELADMAWETVALHYHKATGQMAGPHYRAYAYLLADATRVSIERALEHKVRLVKDYDVLVNGCGYDGNLRCPDKFIPYFTENCGERVLDQTFAHDQMAYTYMNDTYTLGTLHIENMWNQHRDVLGYFGTVEAPFAFCLKCTHDGWDYCSGVAGSVQDKGRVLSVVGFMTNGGDTHINLDKVKNAQISAKDFRVQWEFYGEIGKLGVTESADGTFIVTDKASGFAVTVGFPFVSFDHYPVHFEVTRNGNCLGVAAVLYHGERATIDFGNMNEAMLITFCEADSKGTTPSVVSTAENGCVSARFANLAVSAVMKPAKNGEVQANIHLYRDGEEYKPAF